MATRVGRCINFGMCEVADSKKDVPMPLGATDVICESCGNPIVPIGQVPGAGKSDKRPFILAIAAIVGIILVASFFFFSHKTNVSAISAPAPVAISAPAAVATQATQIAAAPALALCGPKALWSRLGPDLAAGFLSSLGATNPATQVTATDERTVHGEVQGAPTAIRVATHGISAAFAGLRDGECQVTMASRRIKTVEAVNLRSLGNMLAPSAEHVVGLDGIAVIVNARNPVPALSMSQLRDIVSGRVTNWSALGGKSGPVRILLPADTLSANDAFQALVLDQATLAPNARRFEDIGALSAAVAADPNAIGFIGFPNIAHSKTLPIESGALALAPTALTVGQESYPLTRRLFLYTSPSAASSLAGKFVTFVQSDAGQRILDHDGFVGSVTAFPTAPESSRLPSGAPPGYRKLVESFEQARFNFYFQTGSYTLDNKALVDVGRLVEIVNGANNHRAVILAGFTDSTGSRVKNQQLSEDRAKSVAHELGKQNIRVDGVMGFGQELPISDNATPLGREKNRRVEIFITR